MTTPTHSAEKRPSMGQITTTCRYVRLSILILIITSALLLFSIACSTNQSPRTQAAPSLVPATASSFSERVAVRPSVNSGDMLLALETAFVAVPMASFPVLSQSS